MTISTRLPAVGLLLAILVLAAIGVASFSSHRWTMAAGDSSRHTIEVMRQAEAVVSRLADVESSQRAFLLTGEAAQLEAYDASRRKVLRDVARLGRLTADDAAQQARVNRLAPLVTARLDALQAVVALQRTQGRAAALAVIRADLDKPELAPVRDLVREMEGEERRLLAQRLQARRTQSSTTGTLIVFGTVVAGLLMVGSAGALVAQMSRRQRAERSHRESEQRLAVTLASIGDAVIATNTQGRVMFMNAVAEGLTGWTLAGAQGRPLVEVFAIVNEETRATVGNPVERVLREGRTVVLANHAVLHSRDGREIPIDDSAAPIRDGGEDLIGVVLVFRDVSGRREAAKTREEFLRAEAANRAKDEFLSMLSHELRNPLNAMLAWVRLLGRDGGRAELRTRALEVLERNIRTQASLINELLDVSRIISGKFHLDLRPANAVTLIGDCVDSVRLAAQSKGLTLRYDRPAYTLLGVMADGERFTQAFGNVLDNAIKFTPAGGHVDVALEHDVEVLRLVVRDDGKGISEAFLPHVFERFLQADTRTTTRDHGGLGLGLAIVKHLVQGHGGSVLLESAGEGRGVTCTITLPLADNQAACAEPQRTDAASQMPQPVSVLLIDDDTDTLEALTIALEQNGARVFPARNTKQALEAYEREHPMVIVSDISMPGGDGYDFIRTVRARDEGRTPALAMTGLASREDRARALKAGFDEHLSKPIDPEALIRFVQSAAVPRGASLGPRSS